MFEEKILLPLINTITRFADRKSFCINEHFYTYKDFAKHIAGIKAALQSTASTSKRIGLVINDDIETYASIFAIWLEGFAYVPLHPGQPSERNAEIILQAEIELILDSSKKINFDGVKIITVTEFPHEVASLTIKNTPGEELAYILFTSGSTGKPKGVPITRNNLAEFMQAFWDTGIEITENDRCLQGYEMTFDLSIQSYLVPLLKGACTYTIPPAEIKYSYLFGLLEDHQLTFLPLPPSLIRFLRPYFKEINFECVRNVILGAEASQVELISEWSKCVPKADIYNFYGPTEATIYCIYSKFNRIGNTKNINGLMFIGKPMNGINAIVADELNNVLPTGIKGELCVSGKQLTSGYLNNPEKNAQVFFEIERDGKSERFYRTGDLSFIDTEGDVMYGGRLDYQVKVQGYRIELGEIEFHSRAFLSGKNAVAVTFENKLQNIEIALFIESESFSTNDIIEYLKSKIPYYMIPTKIFFDKELPLNSSGKIDRNTLQKSILF